MEGNVSVLHSYLLNNNILESQSSSNKNIDNENREEICENCDNGDEAVKRCKVCYMSMCEFCTEAHRRTRTTKQHSLISLEKVNTARTTTLPGPTSCSKHGGKMLEFLCQSPSCNRPVCQKCVLVDHQGHEYDLIHNVAAKEKAVLRKLIEEVNTRAKHFDAARTVLERAEEETLETGQNVNKEIDYYIDGIIEMLEQKRCSLKEEVKSITAAKTKLLQTEKGDIALVLATMQSSIDFAEQARDNTEDVDIVSLKPDIVQRLAELKLKKIPKVQTKTLEIVFETTFSKIKELIMNIAHVSERSNYKEVISPKSQNFPAFSQKQESKHLEPALTSELDSPFYDDYPFDYYKLVPLEVDEVGNTCQDVFDSSPYFNLCTVQDYNEETDAKSLSCDAKEMGNDQTSPCSPTKYVFDKKERTCPSMCKVYRLPTNCYSDELSATPKKREFILQAKTKDGLLQKACGDKVCVTIQEPNGRRQNLHVVDNSDGSYSFECTPQTCGSYLFHITVNGKSVKKEGFSWEVKSCSKVISDRGL